MLSYTNPRSATDEGLADDMPRGPYDTLLPRPKRAGQRPGRLDLRPGVAVRVGLRTEAAPVGAHLPDGTLAAAEQSVLRAVARLGLLAGNLRDDGPPVPLEVRVGRTATEPEGPAHTIDVAPEGVTIEATDLESVSHALTTLAQLLPPSALRGSGLPDTALDLPCGRVEDSPRYPWRGGMLDVVRHFAPKRTVLRYIDLLAAHRFNRMHLHLTDDQGWRIASERFPRLAEVGSWRPSTRLGPDGEHDRTPHGGRYSLADLREIARYGRERGVVVVPEIDVPGHTSALRAAYPELGRPGVDHTVQDTVWAGGSSVSPTRPVVTFLTEVLDELCDAMDVPYVHLGGDECDMSWWSEDPEISREMAEHGYTEPAQMHAHLLRALATHLSARGVRAIVWDEGMVTGGVLDDTIVMAWRGERASSRAAETHDVVRSPLFPTYFNFDQSDDPREPRSEGGAITLDDVAAFAPAPAGWTDAQRGHVLGGQFQVWSEWVPDERRIDYLAFPRACALAEVLWSGAIDDRPDFDARLRHHLARLDALGVEYRPLEGPHPWQQGGEGVWKRTSTDTIGATRTWVESVADAP
ncbi:beta-hexosaminidase [Oerskovia enterophila]|uniref:beta-N-acetylhexosaminidase n=2 Tax=Oerskovia enterophila TaxID=43678 RepID=A0A163Q1B7_9CELL|nr:beta-hexosaminidase [Oerskovia enterophila]